MESQPTSLLQSLGRQILEEAVQEVIAGPPERCDSASLRVLTQTAQVSHALQKPRLSRGGNTSSSGQEVGAPCSSSRGDAPSASAACFTGTAAAAAAGGCLGVADADLLSGEALPSTARRRQALSAALPAVEAELQRRCRLVAAASGYAADDFSGLPDHIRQLQACTSQSPQVEAWRQAAVQVQQAVELLTAASTLLASIIQKHKLGGQRAADEAHAAFLNSACQSLRDKMRVVELQLKQRTYTAQTVVVLQLVAAEVDGALGQTTARLQQASLHLAQYTQMGPQYVQLAREHAAVLEQLEETEFELREIEQFRQLARVMG